MRTYVVEVQGRPTPIEVEGKEGPLLAATKVARSIGADEGTRLAVRTGNGVHGAYVVGSGSSIVRRVGRLNGLGALVRFLAGFRDVAGVDPSIGGKYDSRVTSVYQDRYRACVRSGFSEADAREQAEIEAARVARELDR